jgi:hypothetical protein
VAAPPPILFGEKGLILITYLGDLQGKYKGVETCHLYDVKRDQRDMYVDRRDVPALLKVANAKGELLFTTRSEYL